jgi:tetratricopeptide (TPR) repeat protein
MSSAPQAVFLSYASQDADAARRICDALRAAGVEVWFDQSELRGGDAWDAKIRKQIKECALFLPVISANTNARAEGYFRLEWKLAVDRSHLMADDAPFLLPVVIDETSDPTARVPDRFREVQWTRMDLRETPESLARRVSQLLRGAAVRPDRAGPSSRSRRSRGVPGYVWPLVGLAFAVVFVGRPMGWWSRPNAAAPSSAPALSEARQMAARARAMSLDKYDASPDDFATAEGLVKRALELDQNDGEIWAVSSLLNFAFNSRGFDRSSARTAAARAHAERAVKLAPESVEALFALGRWQRDNENASVSETTLLKVLQKDPRHTGALHNLGYLYDRMNRVDEAAALYAREAENPAAAPLAAYTEFLLYFRRARFAEAERAVRKSIAAQPATNSQSGLALLLLTANGDAHGAAQAVGTGAASHRPIWLAAFAHLCGRRPDEALRVLERLADDYILDNFYTGPKTYFIGLAHALAGRGEAARVAWEAGLALVDQRLRQAPADRDLHLERGELLALLGREAEALREARTVEQLPERDESWIFTPVRIYAALGRTTEALPIIGRQLQFARDHRPVNWHLTPALLRIDPRWDRLRGDPRFQQLTTEPAPVASTEKKK